MPKNRAVKEKSIPTFPTIPCPYWRLLRTTEKMKLMRTTDRKGRKNLEDIIFLKKDEGGGIADKDGICPKIGILHPLAT
jgi:hypothetical protein